jgi:hypothetical protein
VKQRVKPPGNQERRIFRPPSLASPTAHQAAQLEALGAIRGALGDMSGLLDRLAPAVIAQKTVQLDANGTATDQFRIPFRSISVDYFGGSTLTVAAAPLGVGAPGPGVGVAKVGPGGFAVCNMRATVVSFYGLPGDLVTYCCMALPQPPCGTASPSAVVTEVIPAGAQLPAAGTNYTFTVPASGPAMNLTSVRATFTSSAAVANRFLSLILSDAAGNQLATIPNSSTVVASSSVFLSWLNTVSTFVSNPSGNAVLPIPMRTLLPGWTLKLNAAGIDVADQWSGIVLVFTD